MDLFTLLANMLVLVMRRTVYCTCDDDNKLAIFARFIELGPNLKSNNI